MDKGKSSVEMEEFQKGRHSPAHGASEESEEPCRTEGCNLERQDIVDEIKSKPLNDPTDRAAKRRKPALKVESIAVTGESSTRENSPARGVSEETKAATGKKGLNIESQEIVDDGLLKTPVHYSTDQGESLQKEDDDESTERSAKRCKTSLKVLKNDDGAGGSTHVDEDLAVIKVQNESGGEQLEENSQNELSDKLGIELKEILLACLWRRKFGKR